MIHARLCKYCEDTGLGAAVRIAEATNGVLTDDDVREMRQGGRRTLEQWRVLDAALDWLEKKQKKR